MSECKFKIGDRVSLIMPDVLYRLPRTTQAYVGTENFLMTGTVVHIVTDPIRNHIGISFDESHPQFHDCYGHCPNNTGWYFLEQDVIKFNQVKSDKEELIESLYDNLFE